MLLKPQFRTVWRRIQRATENFQYFEKLNLVNGTLKAISAKPVLIKNKPAAPREFHRGTDEHDHVSHALKHNGLKKFGGSQQSSALPAWKGDKVIFCIS